MGNLRTAHDNLVALDFGFRPDELTVLPGNGETSERRSRVGSVANRVSRGCIPCPRRSVSRCRDDSLSVGAKFRVLNRRGAHLQAAIDIVETLNRCAVLELHAF